MEKRVAIFIEMGCRTANHGLEKIVCEKCIPELVDQIFKQRLSGKKPTLKEADMYQTAIMLFLEKEYRKAEFVMKLHFGVIRNDSTRLY